MIQRNAVDGANLTQTKTLNLLMEEDLHHLGLGSYWSSCDFDEKGFMPSTVVVRFRETGRMTLLQETRNRLNNRVHSK